MKKKLNQIRKSVLNMASRDSQIDKPQRGCPKRAELPNININTGAQGINTERASLMLCAPSILNMASSDSQIEKPQRGCPKRVELPDVNINTGAQSINTERTSLTSVLCL